MRTEQRRPPGRPRNVEADNAVLTAALDLIAESGVEGVSIEQAAKRAGVARTTVYRRYATRDELAVAALVANEAAVLVSFQVPDRPSPADLVATWSAGLSEPRARTLLRRMMSVPREHPKLWAAFREASDGSRDQSVHDLVVRARENGQLPADADVEMVQALLTGAVAVHLTNYPDDVTFEEVSEYFWRVLRTLGFRVGGS
ncbi:TetR/AcrR family transcriptional regulator [Promicromonospora iranensis]|uniref:TetR/AcrR family transcriptional regulator n=1 Tax=Promicromonospora iranensis TaxID=1105144 RepID=UPI0023A934C2|nr:TetR/AcrR family transcriptional regulator [Promicromonospora iranensis]